MYRRRLGSYFARLCAAFEMLKSSGERSTICIGYRTVIVRSVEIESRCSAELQGYPSWSKGPDLSSGA